MLLGRGNGERVPWHVTRSIAARNDDDDPRCRYLVAPEFQLSAERQAREAGEDVVGYYHSHPDCEALPSDCDRAQAWPGYLYIICSVAKARAVDLGLFTLTGQGGAFRRARAEPARAFNPFAGQVPSCP